MFARGQCATSWEMGENHKLVTWGPYRYIRHPAYLAYFLIFVGFFAMWPNLVTLVPMIAIRGYVKVAQQEEKLMEQRFTEKYVEYKRKTGQFFPRFWRCPKKESESHGCYP